jgi:hypothetical protein
MPHNSRRDDLCIAGFELRTYITENTRRAALSVLPLGLDIEAFILTLFKFDIINVRDFALCKSRNSRIAKAGFSQQVTQRALIEHLRMICPGMDKIANPVIQRESLQELVRRHRAIVRQIPPYNSL